MNQYVDLVNRLALQLKAHDWQLSSAESCTGGGLAALFTAVSGSSSWFDGGFITYSNQAKMDLLGVKYQTLASHGAVSEETALEMATGTLKARPNSDLSVAITGIAGPTGGLPQKPVGTVWVAFAGKHFQPHAKHFVFDGDREQIRAQATQKALLGLIDCTKMQQRT